MVNPEFAVVGHPNKGKSSIVSTLTQNDSIHISARSGTTENAQRFTVKTENGCYDLFDTPGFQRPTQVLRWLNAHCSDASERANTVLKFIQDPECQQRFKDEVSLLAPIIKGAAILYVVDGSRPYGIEYEAEMEILRWTGQPSMALINPIENEDCVEQWHNALSQFFKSVRVFNPMSAEYSKQLELLQTFAHLNPAWSSALTVIIQALKQKRQAQQRHSAELLAELVVDMCRYQQSHKALSPTQAENLKPILMSQYKRWITKREETAISALLQIYAHNNTYVDLAQLSLPPDLFDTNQWFAWGLNKKQLVGAAAAAGAIGGAALDAMVAGHSFMLGALGGGLMGAGSAYFGATKLLDMSVKGLPLGGYEACVGPITNRNFPYVIIGRFVHLHQQIANLNHANRQTFSLQATDFQDKVEGLAKSSQRSLHKACESLIKHKPIEDLPNTLEPLLTDAFDAGFAYTQ